MKAKFSCKVRNNAEAKSADLDIFAGDLVGNGLWTFQEIDGNTKVTIRFNVRSNNLLMPLLSPFVDLAKRHSEAVQKGFKAYNCYLREKKGNK